MKTRFVEIVDLVEIGKVLPNSFYNELIDNINNSEVSFGNNDDTLVLPENFLIFMEDTISDSEKDWSNNSEVLSVMDFLNSNKDCFVALGS